MVSDSTKILAQAIRELTTFGRVSQETQSELDDLLEDDRPIKKDERRKQ